jgi:hypothetical protein
MRETAISRQRQASTYFYYILFNTVIWMLKRAVTRGGFRIRISLFYCGSDPEPAFHCNTDRESPFDFDADPNPAPHQGDANLRILIYKPFRAPIRVSTPPL